MLARSSLFFLSAVKATPFTQTVRGMAAKTSGTVKWFDAKKGFGFIAPADGSSDVFVHHSGIISNGFRALAEGETVEFEVIEDAHKNNKKFAVSVTGPNGAPVKGPEREGGYQQREHSGYQQREQGGRKRQY